jgi:putative aminopeptidase FrvX
VSSEDWPRLREHSQRHTAVRLIAAVTRTPAASFNVTARIAGVSRSAPPLVVMTPRSGWYSSASERGGGIACWLELMRMLQHARPPRDVLFVASSGHELGHLGIDAFIANRPGIVPGAVGWMHFGANIGAAMRPGSISPASDEDPERRHAAAAMSSGNTIQASDDRGESVLSRAMTAVDLGISRRVPRGTVPGGEAEVVHRNGGRYVSVIGSNALFHHPDDRGAKTADIDMIARFTTAFAAVAEALSAG